MRRTLPWLPLILSISSCRTLDPSNLQTAEGDSPSTSVTEPSQAPNLCVAIRGNGHYIASHFGGLARIVEDMGLIDAVAGGSSGSISAFLYESMRLNPGIDQCNNCTDSVRRARLSLLIKSTRGLIDLASQSSEAAAVRGLTIELQNLKNQIHKLGGLNPQQAALDIQTLIRSASIAEILNWELFGMLYTAAGRSALELTQDEIRMIIDDPVFLKDRVLQNPHLDFALDQINQAFSTFGAFKADSQEIFFRPGVVNFFAFIEVVGRVADFYSGRGPADQIAMEKFLTECSTSAFGQSWSQWTTQPDGQSCASQFQAMAAAYFKARGRERLADSRLNDPIGDKVTSIIATGIIDGAEDVERLNASQRRYFQEQRPDFQINFDRISAGYWAPQDISARICTNVRATQDPKGQRCLPLGGGKWGDILPYSPAEPGLARALVIPNKSRASVGGWIDLAPVDALKAIECQTTVYLTRRQDESPFVAGVARQLNMDLGDSQRSTEKSLFDLSNPSSSISRSLERADVIWCTDWNTFTDLEVDGMMDESYCAETVINRQTNAVGPYTKSRLSRDAIRGCTWQAPTGTGRRNPEICGSPRN